MGYKILIVDDSVVTRSVLKRTIGMTGVPIDEIYEASNGQEGLASLESEPVDLVLTDLNMPSMTGVEMTKRVLGNPKTKDIPVVVISTEFSETRIEELKAEGIRQFIHKPFTPEGIRQVLLDVLEPCPS